MKHRVNWLGVALALALLALVPAAVTLAQEEGEELTLTGLLSGDEENGYMLIEQESGDSVPLEGVGLADHVGSTVKVTGKWGEDAEGRRVFQVSRVEAISAPPGS